MGATYVKGTVLANSSGTSVSGVVSSTAGNALICGGVADTGSSTPTTSGGGITTWTKDASGTYGSQSGASISSGPNSSGGSNTITVSRTGASGLTAIVHEWSGLPTAGTLADATSPAIKTATSASASTNSETNVDANAVFVGWVSNQTGANPATFTSGGTGWTQPADAEETNGSSFTAAAMAYAVVSSAAANSQSWAIDSSVWGALIACYQVAAGGGGGGGGSTTFPQLGLAPAPKLAAAGWLSRSICDSGLSDFVRTSRQLLRGVPRIRPALAAR